MISLFRKIKRIVATPATSAAAAKEIYSNAQFADLLENWGRDHVWLEIQALLAFANGRVLDIACGSGNAMVELRKTSQLTAYGCDFSDLFIKRAHAKSINRLALSDATKLPFRDKAFDYSYSIGSLEHFSEAGIDLFLSEALRVTSKGSFHQIPVSRTENHGWITPHQHYFNNRLDWWMPKFKKAFREVHVLPSGWEDDNSLGKWFICVA